MPSRYTYDLAIFDDGNWSCCISYTFTLLPSFPIERPLCVRIYWVECMSCEVWNQRIKDTIACFATIGFYVINGVLQCYFISLMLYTFNLHDSWIKGIKISFWMELLHNHCISAILLTWQESSFVGVIIVNPHEMPIIH